MLGKVSYMIILMLNGAKIVDASAHCEFFHGRCMSPSEYNVSEAICQEQGLNLTCTNEARELYVSGHGQFFLGCIDIETAKEVYGNPVHPSQQNQTDGTSGAFLAHGSFVAVALAAVIGLFM